MLQHQDGSRSKSGQGDSPARPNQKHSQSKVLVLGQNIPPTQEGLNKLEQNLNKQRDAVQTCKNLNAAVVIQCVATTNAGRKARANERSLSQQQRQIEETRGEITALREHAAACSHLIDGTTGSSPSAKAGGRPLDPQAPSFLGPLPNPETDVAATLRYVEQVLLRGTQMLQDHSVWYTFFRGTHNCF